MKAVMNITEAACYVGSTEKTLYSLAEQGQIPHRRQGRKLIFLQRELDAWIDLMPGTSIKVFQETLKRRGGHMVDPPMPMAWEPAAPQRDTSTPLIMKRGPAGPKFTRKTPVVDEDAPKRKHG